MRCKALCDVLRIPTADFCKFCCVFGHVCNLSVSIINAQILRLCEHTLNRVTTCLENLEMSGINLTAVRELTKSQGKISGKLFIANFTSRVFW